MSESSSRSGPSGPGTGDSPSCAPCDECCEGCKECDCNSPDCEFKFKITPAEFPDVLSGGGSYMDRCCEPVKFEGDNDGCNALAIKACCNGLCGCGDKAHRVVRWVVCNQVNRCMQVFATFRIAGLRKTEGGDLCPDEDTDCCKLQYRFAGSGFPGTVPCGFCKPGTTCEPNGIAPGPGFCLPPCSQLVFCFVFRVGSVDCNDCEGGCKRYADDPDGTPDCCAAEAVVIEPCFQVCCTDNPNDSVANDDEDCDSNCREALESADPPTDCPDCCGCCEPSKTQITDEGYEIITPSGPAENCCENTIIKLTDTFDWDCCENVEGACESSSSGIACDAYPNLSVDFDCASDGVNSECLCFFEPVPDTHPQYIVPCECDPGNADDACFGFSDNCKYGEALVLQGQPDEFCGCYQQSSERVEESCAVDPCTISDTANSPCPY